MKQLKISTQASMRGTGVRFWCLSLLSCLLPGVRVSPLLARGQARSTSPADRRAGSCAAARCPAVCAPAADRTPPRGRAASRRSASTHQRAVSVLIRRHSQQRGLHAAGFGAADDEVAAISLSGFSHCCPTARGGPVWTGGEGNWMGESMPLHAASYGHSTTLRCPRASAPELKHGAAA
jgi:hypothetical protein